jgi:hypothetical protein
MKLKKKKIPYSLLLLLLAIGASLIIGFLSFTGMFTLMPMLGLAIGSFGLSAAYEFDIYLQNIKGALNKLFKRDFIKNQIATDSLRKLFTNNIIDTKAEDCPQFFKDYKAQIKLLSKFGHKRLDEKSQKIKQQIEKTLKDMEKWYAIQLFSNKIETLELTAYEIELRRWLNKSKQDGKTTPSNEAKALFAKRSNTYKFAIAFSVLSGFFMSVGLTYLLVSAFSILPVLATLPFVTLPAIIIPMALIAGAAYTFLIYNAVTDMIHNDTLRKWYNKLRDDLKQGITPRNMLLTVSAVALLVLTVALTICTAGTWWTVAKNALPLFSWMSKIPSFVMGIINPIIQGTSQLIFNLQNTSESLEMIDKATKDNLFKKIGKGIREIYYQLRDNENWLQIINPFRLFLKLTVTPLRLLFFFGHLISIGVTADRIPGIPEIASAILGIISEGIEDCHYFVGDLLHNDHHHHDTKDLVRERLGGEHGHNHSTDIPTYLLKALFTPLYLVATAWDYLASRAMKKGKVLSWGEVWDKQQGLPVKESIAIDPSATKPSAKWQLEQSMYRIDCYVAKHLNKESINSELATEKATQLQSLRKDLGQMQNNTETEIIKRITTEAENPVYGKQRFFNASKRTRTEDFLADLPERIHSANAIHS